MSSGPGPADDLDGQHLAGDEVEVLGEGVETHDVQPDAVGHLEPARLAQVLHEAHHLAGRSALAQLVVEGEIERDHLAALAGDGEALLPAHAQLHVLG